METVEVEDRWNEMLEALHGLLREQELESFERLAVILAAAADEIFAAQKSGEWEWVHTAMLEDVIGVFAGIVEKQKKREKKE